MSQCLISVDVVGCCYQLKLNSCNLYLRYRSYGEHYNVLLQHPTPVQCIFCSLSYSWLTERLIQSLCSLCCSVCALQKENIGDLLIVNAQLSQAGMYTCTAQTVVDSASASAKLVVRGKMRQSSVLMSFSQDYTVHIHMLHTRPILVLFYTNTKEAYYSSHLPLLIRSDHRLVHLLYKSLIHR